MSEVTRLGTGTFIRRTGITTAKMRELEAAGIIQPVRADSGWRQFSESDVQATQRWQAERAAGRRSARR
jgi:DNA-binding transcriptional MerR regulator